MGREIHVSVNGKSNAAGTKEQPLKTISEAAKIAKPGDFVIVHEGIYREWVQPENGGTSHINRITYKAAEGEKVVIKGSERIENWELLEGTVWKAVVDNKLFGNYNPYEEEVFGDWFVHPLDWRLHAGDVYLNGCSFYEARTLEEVKNPVKRIEGFSPFWKAKPELILNPEGTIYQWFAEVQKESTIIYANFHGADPNKELTEINVRKCCFYPEKTGRNYITVAGFEMAHAACPWTPPTADQPGLIGPNWSKGWIIENNIIHDAKCSGISIGKEASTGHNLFTQTKRKPGYQYQMEAVFRALQIGWSKETIGSHIIRNNTVYDCGQNGIVGHMGCAFSEIYNNHIYNIAVKHEYYGYEIAGIKLHAAIDVQIHNNNIHNCTLGCWLDWEAQGARISKNLFYANDRDLFIEVTHGPHLVDTNILASAYNFDNVAQGGAFVNNLCCGKMRREAVLDRSTPYHFPHSTSVAGSTFVYSGDDRWYQNIFLGGQNEQNGENGQNIEISQLTSGTVSYNGSPASLEEFCQRIEDAGHGDHDLYPVTSDPAYIDNNAYLSGAEAFDREETNFKSDADPQIKIICENGQVFLEMHVEKDLLDLKDCILDTPALGMVRIVEQAFDDPCGNPIVFDTDFNNEKRTEQSNIGPIVGLKEGFNRVKVWG